MRQIFEYLLGLLSRQYGIQIHAYVVMSDHYHLVVTDTEGQLPDFQRDFNSLLARSVNAFRRRWEGFWDRRSYNAVKLLGDDDVLDSMAYTLANPVEARLVNRAGQWLGATSAGMKFGQPRQIRRPSQFFSDGKPEVVELEITRPACFAELDNAEVLARLEADVAQREAMYAKLGKPMGMARVLKQDWRTSAKSFEPRRQLQPTIKGKDKWARIEALQRSKAWLLAYKDALAQFVAGVRDVVFPAGTWWMCAQLGCRIALE